MYSLPEIVTLITVTCTYDRMSFVMRKEYSVLSVNKCTEN
jgi:hypothetical protein